MAALIAVSSVDDTFAGLATLSHETLQALLGKPAPARAPWWISKGKTVLTDVASARVTATFETLRSFGDVRIASDCHGAALA